MSTDQAAIDELAQSALRPFGLDPGSRVELINVSENWTYRIDTPQGDTYALRVHRPGYHTAEEIASELEWMDALREDGAVETPEAVRVPGPKATTDSDGDRHELRVTVEDAAHPAAFHPGERVCQIATPALGERNVVLFSWLAGETPDPDAHDLVPGFRTLGALSARMHAHARAWQPPAGFVRFAWDYDTTLGASGHWGRWQDGLGMDAEARDVLGRLDDVLRRRLEAFGKRPERFGLVHADIRLANLLVEGERVRVIDFDDCGFSWFMYDFATTVSFIEDHPMVPELKQAWIDGYRSAAPLSADDEAELDTFVMLRRLLLVAWIGSHHEFATEAAELGAGFTEGSCHLAERYLSTHS